MNSSTLRILSNVAGLAALVGVILCIVALAGGTSLGAAAAVTLIGIVLFFALRHFANRNIL